MKPILEMRSIVKEFPGVRALDGVSLLVHRLAVCGILAGLRDSGGTADAWAAAAAGAGGVGLRIPFVSAAI